VVGTRGPEATAHGLALLRLYADTKLRDTGPLLRQLSPHQRLNVMAALVVLITCAAMLLVFIRASGRFARWYVNRPHRRPQPTTDLFRSIVDGETPCASEKRTPPSKNSTS
jgi:hypothetical protein